MSLAQMTHKPRVWIVEDDSAMSAMLMDFLSGYGYECRDYTAGTKALEQIDQSALAPDLIISDLNMPQMNGYEFIKEVRKLGLPVPILLITAFGSRQGASQALTLGANGYLPKPFRLNDLISEVERLLEAA